MNKPPDPDFINDDKKLVFNIYVPRARFFMPCMIDRKYFDLSQLDWKISRKHGVVMKNEDGKILLLENIIWLKTHKKLPIKSEGKEIIHINNYSNDYREENLKIQTIGQIELGDYNNEHELAYAHNLAHDILNLNNNTCLNIIPKEFIPNIKRCEEIRQQVIAYVDTLLE